MRNPCQISIILLNKRGNILFSLLLFFIISGYSQFSFYKNYTSNEGLPSSKVYDMLQDKKGYMWFATENGVSRYDGYEFRNFTTKDGLPTNSTLKLYEDFIGRIWFLSFEGPISYFENNQIVKFELNDELLNPENQQFFNKIHIDSSQTIWLSPYDFGLYSISSSDKIFKEDIKTEKRVSDKFTLFYFYEDNKLLSWVHLPQIESKYSKELLKKDIKSIDFFQNSNHVYYQNYECILGQDDYLFSFNIFLKEVRKGAVVYEKTFKNEIIAIYKDNDQNLWISEQFNCLYFYPEGNLHTKPIEFFHDISVSKIIQDYEGNYWFSTTEQGVYFVPSLMFTHYDKEYLGIKNDIIFTMETFENQLFFTSDSKEIHCFFIKDYGIIENINFNLDGFVRSNIFDILITTDKYLWISDSQNLMYHLNGTKTSYKLKRHVGGHSLFQMSNGDILLSHRLGYFIIEKDGFELKTIQQPFAKRTFDLYETNDSILLLGTIEGLYKFEKDIYSKYDSLNEILNSRISAIKSIKKKLWIGTFNDGIAIETDSGYNYLNEENGLISNRIKVIFIENDSNIWVGTNKGLSHIIYNKFNTENSFNISNYTIWDGLPSNEINHIIKYENRIWLATNKGLVSFNPEKIKKPTSLLNINLEKITVNESQIITISDSAIYKSNENNISFDYKAITFKDPGNITYYYKLDGQDKNWLETRNTSVRYPGLKYGDYVFNVKAKNGSGILSEPLTYKFIIQKHYTQTHFFRFLVLICLIVIVYFIILVITRFYRKREHLKRQVILAEQTALRAQMNPHFVFNSLNSIHDFILKRDDKNANLYLSNFSTLMRRILETSQVDSISLKEELQTIKLYLELETLRFEGLFRYVINIDKALNLDDVFIPSMLLQTYIENAIWHGLVPNGTMGLLELNFELLENDKLLISIVDNGIGREKASETSKRRKNHRSMGMHNSNERIQLINKLNRTNTTINVIDLFNDDNSSAGTRIEIIFEL